VTLFQELDLDVSSTEEVCIPPRAFAYDDLYDMLENGDTIVWLTLRLGRPSNIAAVTLCLKGFVYSFTLIFLLIVLAAIASELLRRLASARRVVYSHLREKSADRLSSIVEDQVQMAVRFHRFGHHLLHLSEIPHVDFIDLYFRAIAAQST
jgi:hypothetical protein